jgi:cytochrome c peroxidase
MHDGSIPELKQVIDFFNSGGEIHANKDPRIKPLNLTRQQKDDLLAFLKTLTDEEFVSNVGFTP